MTMGFSAAGLRYHEEVVAALRAIGNPRYGEAIRQDRRSQLEYLGISVPELRAAAKRGFSFYTLPEEEVLAAWDELWRNSPYGDVLFAAIEYYRANPRRRTPSLWPVVSEWAARVDNWAHSDALSGLYSYLLEAQYEEIYPRMEAWNAAENEWLRRASLVSLIHYSGKNAVFLPLEQVLSLLTNCLADRRHYVETAVGWVLREMGHAYPSEVRAFLEAHRAELSAPAFARAIERRPAAEKAELKALRKALTPPPTPGRAPG